MIETFDLHDAILYIFLGTFCRYSTLRSSNTYRFSIFLMFSHSKWIDFTRIKTSILYDSINTFHLRWSFLWIFIRERSQQLAACLFVVIYLVVHWEIFYSRGYFYCPIPFSNLKVRISLQIYDEMFDIFNILSFFNLSRNIG